ncbi:MAG: methionyl aminopeptidase [SAR324 cluster bacterium]|nr:methionyl aminopeptidase [SAR324 cluster bacterium]
MKNISRNAPCPCGSGKKFKKCHLSQDKQNNKRWGKGNRTGIIIKTKEQIEGIRKSSQLTCKILDLLEEQIRPGITTNEINEWVHDYTIDNGAYPAPLNYRGFPKSVCTSLNEVICHGIPDETVLKDGDILNVDVTCILDGYYGDSNRMYLIGNVSEEAKTLSRVAKECLYLGIEQVKPFNTIGDIGFAIQEYAENKGFSVVRDFCGHGVGIEFHEDPQVPHYGDPKTGPVLTPNMVFTIEPMINMGRYESRILADRWTAVTADGSLSAQWEHTLLVTEDGVEVLTESVKQ